MACERYRMADYDLDTEFGRLASAREERFPTAAAFAEKVGMNPVTYRAYETGQNGFAKHAAAFARHLGVTAEWLLTGTAQRQAQSQGSRSDRIDSSPDLPVTQVIGAGETVSIATLDLSYAMGEGVSIDDYVEEVPTEFDVGFLRRRTRSEFTRLRLARGVGDSMYPTLLMGDVVLIDTTQDQLTKQDAIYAIALYGAAAIKRLRKIGPAEILIKSDNPTVDDQPVPEEAVRIHGRVIWFGRDL